MRWASSSTTHSATTHSATTRGATPSATRRWPRRAPPGSARWRRRRARWRRRGASSRARGASSPPSSGALPARRPPHRRQAACRRALAARSESRSAVCAPRGQSGREAHAARGAARRGARAGGVLRRSHGCHAACMRELDGLGVVAALTDAKEVTQLPIFEQVRARMEDEDGNPFPDAWDHDNKCLRMCGSAT